MDSSNIFKKDRQTKKTLAQFKLGGQTNADYDKKLVYSLSRSRVPSWRQLKYYKRYLSKTELYIFRASLWLALIAAVFLFSRIYLTNRESIPAQGGEYSEGIVGLPKNINPLYATVSDADSDLARLIYSGLFKRNGQGELEKDLVQEYSVSEDGKTYSFQLKNGAKWHNGGELKVDDAVFTFEAIQNSDYKSPLRSSFIGVSIEKIDDTSFKLVLAEPYAAFLDLLTFGIMPQELWSQIPPETALLAELNLKPIGSGPYRFKSLVKDKTGVIKTYNLEANPDYYGEKPKISALVFKFYGNTIESISALNQGEVEGIAYLPKEDKENIRNPKLYNIQKLELPQITAVFFNLKANSPITDKAVRHALALAIDKDAIIESAVSQSAKRIDSPVLAESFAYKPDIKKYDYNAEEAKKLLDAAGWKAEELSESQIAKAREEAGDDEDKKAAAEELAALGAGTWRKNKDQYLAIKLTTVDRQENDVIIEEIKRYWEAVHIKTILEVLPADQLQSEVIKGRKFEALFYGEVVGLDPDSYVFWHSSQTGDAGLNITGYSNKEVDKLLEEARVTADQEQRKEKYFKFQELVVEDEPAIFMYSPYYNYLQHIKVNGFDTALIQVPSDRFNNIEDWYIKTKLVINWGTLSFFK